MVIKVKYNGEWVKIPYLSSDHGQGLVEEAPKDGAQYARQNGVWSVVNIPEVDFTEINQKISQNTAAIAANTTAIQSKVDKVDGFGLSSNDYTSQEKTKLAGLSNYTLPTASDTVKGGIKVGTGLTMNGEVLSATGGGMADSVEWDNVLSKPKFATVATSGAYNDLTGRPNLATVATSGSYVDLSNKPTIPTVDVNKEYVDTQLATKSDLPDYTVFDIIMEITSSDNPSISQENYNKLLEKLPSNAVNTLPVRDNGMYISSLLGGYNVNGNNSIWFHLESNMGILQDYSIQIFIYQDLTVSVDSGTKYLIPTSNGIDIHTNLTHDLSENNTKQLTIHTTGDGTKSLMDDGKYRKLPVYGRNLLLGSGKEVSNSNYNIANYWLAEQIPEGTQVTVTIWGELGEDVTSFALYNSGGGAGAGAPTPTLVPVNGKASITFNWNIHDLSSAVSNTHLAIFTYPFGGAHTDISTIHKIKLEYGDISAEWSPAWEDIPDLEERYAYGVEWDTASSSPDGVRVGNMQLHRELPIQSKIRGVILDNKGEIKSYLNNSNWGNINTEYLTESVMTEIPEHWYKLYQDGTKFRMMLSAVPLPGYSHIDQFYISSFESGIDRQSSTLISSYGVGSTNVNKRGGDNTAEWDNTYRSLLGLPVTNLTRDQFRQAARKRGSGWEMYTYGAHKTLFWLFAVEYATLNSQKSFNAQKDANGFAQGGLGAGPTQMTDWTNFNNNNPLIPCGYTNEFGNGSGEKAYVVKNSSDGTHATLMANRYRGIENPFGHIWKHTDGANIQVTTGDDGLSILWTTNDPSNFSDTSYTGYDKKGNVCRINGYVKKMLLGEDSDIIATEVGGSTSTYWCDNYYTNVSVNRMQLVVVGGRSDDGLNAGLTDMGTTNSSGVANNIGSRLCFFPKYKSTEITTTTE